MSGLAEIPAGVLKILVVAIGNADRGDDGAGMLVAAQLAGRLPPDVALLTRSGDILALIDDWAGYDAAICVDAAAPLSVPGRIHRIEGSDRELPADLAFPSSHAFGLAEAVALSRALHVLPGIFVVYAIEGAVFAGGAAVTPEVSAAAAEAAACIIGEITRIRSEYGCDHSGVSRAVEHRHAG